MAEKAEGYEEWKKRKRKVVEYQPMGWELIRQLTPKQSALQAAVPAATEFYICQTAQCWWQSRVVWGVWYVLGGRLFHPGSPSATRGELTP